MISDFCHSWSPTLFFCLKKSIPLSIKAQMKDQKLKSPHSIERNLNRSTNGSRARKCHTNIFPSFDLFFWKLLSYGHFVRCSNTAMMNQCFGNISASGVPLASSFDLLNCCFAATNWLELFFVDRAIFSTSFCIFSLLHVFRKESAVNWPRNLTLRKLLRFLYQKEIPKYVALCHA